MQRDTERDREKAREGEGEISDEESEWKIEVTSFFVAPQN